jgi:5'(3')-deoxyribonucleotidase
MRVGIDLDGVCYNFTKALAQYIEQQIGRQYPLVPTCWDFYKKDWHMSLKDYLAWFDEGVNDGYIFRIGEPAPGCMEALQYLRQQGHTIHLVTDRNVGRRAKENTVLWLEEYGLPYDTLTFCDGNKDIVNVDIVVDDNPGHVGAYRARGIEAYVMGFDNRTDMTCHPRYLEGWDQFLDIVDSKANGRPIPFMKAIIVEAPDVDKPSTRTFNTGATRDTDSGKLDPEGFYTPRVIHRFSQYMDNCRHLLDGTLRDSDNWQKGIPRPVYMKSLWRHFLATWWEHRRWLEGDDTLYSQDRLETDLCGVLFNTQGMLNTILKDREQESF